MLSSDEILRYQRHLSLPGFGEAAQLRLKSTRVLVVGAGGLGCPVLQYLSAAGVGCLGIVDDDDVSLSNLQRQILFIDADIGQPKAERAAMRLQAMNSHVNCEVHPIRLTFANAIELIASYDVVVDCSDNFATRYLINDACVLAEKPFVYGALHTFQGQASVFNYMGGPTYSCLFPNPPDPKDAPNCSEIGVLGVLPGIIGVIQATEAIKVLCEIGKPLSGRLLLFDVLDMQQREISFERSATAADIKELHPISEICSTNQIAGKNSESEDEITVNFLRDRSEKIHFQIIDVRENWERQLCQLESVHLPLADLINGTFSLQALGLDPKLPTCVYCKAGSRSLQAIYLLRDQYGFSEIESLRGGILEWANLIDPRMTKY